MADDKVVEAAIDKLEEAREAEGQFKDTKITEALVHLKIEVTDQTYADLVRDALEEAENGDKE